MQTSQQGIDFITRWEGLETEPYTDSAGLLTIGVGHLLTRSELSSGKLHINGQPVRWRDGITVDQAKDLLAQDLLPAEDAVNALDLDLTQQQFDALVSFAFNVGGGALLRSTLAKKLRAGEFNAAPGQFARWVYAGGRKIRGLANRRQSESNLFTAGMYA